MRRTPLSDQFHWPAAIKSTATKALTIVVASLLTRRINAVVHI